MSWSDMGMRWVGSGMGSGWSEGGTINGSNLCQRTSKSVQPTLGPWYIFPRSFSDMSNIEKQNPPFLTPN